MSDWQSINATVNAIPHLAETLVPATGSGSLDGLTMSIKDSFEVTGLKTAVGARIMQHYQSKTDAIAVARLRAAGATILGKSNIPMFASDWQSFNDVYGQTNNPYDLDRSPGGSSGGAAAAIAAGLTEVELGSDLAGSIRLPAHFCGIYGLKPSYGVIPMQGHIPPAPGALAQTPLTVTGPLAKNAARLTDMFNALTTPHEGETPPFTPNLLPARTRNIDNLRIGLWLDDPACPVDSQVGGVLRHAVNALTAGGARIVEKEKPVSFNAAFDAFFPAMVSLVAAGLPKNVIRSLQEQVSTAADDNNSMEVRYARAAVQSATELARNTEKRAQQRALWQQYFADVDLLLMPACVTTAIPHDHSQPAMARTISVNGANRHYFDLMKWIAPATAADLPAIVVPAGMSDDGLPVGLQAMSGYMMDHQCLAFAHMVEQVLAPLPKPSYFCSG